MVRSSPRRCATRSRGTPPLKTERLVESLCTLGNGRFATRGSAPESAAGDGPALPLPARRRTTRRLAHP
ncbi:hypothetical protein AB0C97_28465 [Streptomyces goshikiensis]|uniref:hypothetical protein n=1 Tax=Streptomyces goshikiensis TaxID=1942 RepID=UPI0033C1AFC4